NLYALLQEAFQESPIFRIGGDEFVVLAQEREYDHCTELLDWVKQRVSTLTHESKKEPWERISTALGIAFYDPERHTCANDVFKEADADMYKEKKVMHAERK
ncbi:MAG: GGDEF domain-containing protein, partial [Selenomonadaceae bacterium]|nr:GGDEF domain-containing protein [Selenomonadaceae bacterium]